MTSYKYIVLYILTQRRTRILKLADLLNNTEDLLLLLSTMAAIKLSIDSSLFGRNYL